MMSSTPERTSVRTGVLSSCGEDELVGRVVDAVERLGIGVETYLVLWEVGVSHAEVEEYLGCAGGMSLERYGVARRGGFSHAELLALSESDGGEGTVLGRYLRLVLAGWTRDQVELLEGGRVASSTYSRPAVLGERGSR